MLASERKGTTTTKSFDSLAYAKSMESVGFSHPANKLDQLMPSNWRPLQVASQKAA
jgi:hypothetical protein